MSQLILLTQEIAVPPIKFVDSGESCKSDRILRVLVFTRKGVSISRSDRMKLISESAGAIMIESSSGFAIGRGLFSPRLSFLSFRLKNL